MMKLRTKVLQAGSALLAGLALAIPVGCGDEAPPPAEVVRPIKILEIGGGGEGARREYPGTIGAAQSAELAFEVAGKLDAFPVEEGQEVETGTVLASLDARDYDARLDKAQAKTNHARSEYKRAKTLYDEGVTPEAERERKQRLLEIAEADLREAQKAVEDTVLRAPFSGAVARKLVEDFENVQAKQPVVLLEDDTSLEIVVDVPERDILQRGQDTGDNAEVTRRIDPMVLLTALPDRSFPARVKEFSTSADPTTRTFQVTLAFDPPTDTRVLPGMTAKVTIRAPEELGSGLSLPASSVLADENGASYVWVVDPSAMTVSRRAISVGELAGDRVSVTSGLAPGDWVAVSGVHHLREGMQISRAGD
ncbi:MAG: efflux RND transporter periplasmic adaptor subunit [bacterium]|nr:efflux RND transporter periplasmic adaptor subunit [bacterium]